MLSVNCNHIRFALNFYFVDNILSSIENVVSICSFSITRGGTKRIMLVPADISTRPLSKASETISPAGIESSVPSISPIPRTSFIISGYFSCNSMSFCLRYGATSFT